MSIIKRRPLGRLSLVVSIALWVSVLLLDLFEVYSFEIGARGFILHLHTWLLVISFDVMKYGNVEYIKLNDLNRLLAEVLTIISISWGLFGSFHLVHSETNMAYFGAGLVVIAVMCFSWGFHVNSKQIIDIKDLLREWGSKKAN